MSKLVVDNKSFNCDNIVKHPKRQLKGFSREKISYKFDCDGYTVEEEFMYYCSNMFSDRGLYFDKNSKKSITCNLNPEEDASFIKLVNNIICPLLREKNRPLMAPIQNGRIKFRVTNDTKFYSLDYEVLEHELLQNVRIRFVPIIHFAYVDTDAISSHILINIMSAVVTNIYPSITKLNQDDLIESIHNNNYELVVEQRKQLELIKKSKGIKLPVEDGIMVPSEVMCCPLQKEDEVSHILETISDTQAYKHHADIPELDLI
jgi:hypothetical protein